MENSPESFLDNLINNYPSLSDVRIPIDSAFRILSEAFRKGSKVMTCGNGGSAADAEHIVGELMKGFCLKRPLPDSDRISLETVHSDIGNALSNKLQGALPAISLVSQSALLSAISNDMGGEFVFAQQVYGYGKKGDVLIAISTSGNSKNILNAICVAKSIGLRSIALTGGSGGDLKDFCDVLINVPARTTAAIQEFHLPIYHCICMMLEVELFGLRVF